MRNETKTNGNGKGETMTKLTTATLRSWAWDAEHESRFLDAAALYREALKRYPTKLSTPMYQEDRKGLKGRAEYCERQPVRGGF